MNDQQEIVDAVKQMAAPLNGREGQRMVLAAHRYCLSESYLYGEDCIEWLMVWWHAFEPATQSQVIQHTTEAFASNLVEYHGWDTFIDWAQKQRGEEV